MSLDFTRMNRFVPYSYKDNIARTYYGTVNISYEPALTLFMGKMQYQQKNNMVLTRVFKRDLEKFLVSR